MIWCNVIEEQVHAREVEYVTGCYGDDADTGS